MEYSISASRPTDPQLISFTPECFEAVGIKTVWRIVSPTGFSYPKTFNSLADAVAARFGTQVITESSVPIMRRIRWN